MSWLFVSNDEPRCGVRTASGGHVPAVIAFVVIFPVYFYYQALVNIELLDPVLGGYFTAGAAAAAPFLLYGAWRHRLSLASNSALVVGTFMIFLALLALASWAGIQDGADEEITSSHLAYVFKFVVLFLVARLVHAQETWFRRLSATLLTATIVLVVFTGKDGRFLQAAVLSELYDLPFLLDYQGLAYVFVVIAIYCIPQLRNELRWVFYPVSLAALFLIGARSEFAGFILVALAIEFCHAKSRAMLIGVVLVAALLLAAIYAINQDALSDHRIFGLLKISSDQSAVERAEMHRDALHTIEEHPIFGDYASYEPGHYAHNILSAWVDLGVLGFSALLLLQLFSIVGLLDRFARHSRDVLYIQLFAAQLFTTMLLLFAKNYTYQMIPIALGLYCRFQALRASIPRAAAAATRNQALSGAC